MSFSTRRKTCRKLPSCAVPIPCVAALLVPGVVDLQRTLGLGDALGLVGLLSIKARVR